jgi:predicted acylesterase/phospholipase RssA
MWARWPPSVAGASPGSIVGALVAVGWPVDRIYVRLLDTDFATFKERAAI